MRADYLRHSAPQLLQQWRQLQLPQLPDSWQLLERRCCADPALARQLLAGAEPGVWRRWSRLYGAAGALPESLSPGERLPESLSPAERLVSLLRRPSAAPVTAVREVSRDCCW